MVKRVAYLLRQRPSYRLHPSICFRHPLLCYQRMREAQDLRRRHESLLLRQSVQPL